jgi:putative membrane protein
MIASATELAITSNVNMKKLIIGAATCLFAFSASIASAQMSRLSEAQIALIVVTANTIDINAGKLAIKQSKNKEVLDFARQMVSDHTAVNKAATDLVKKLKIKPAQSDNVKNLKGDAA